MKAYVKKLQTFFTSILKRKPSLRLAPAYIVGDEFDSGTVTQKEYTCYEAAVLTMKKAAAEGRVIWPAPASRNGVRKVRIAPKMTVEASSRYQERLRRDDRRNKALAMFGKDHL